MSEALAQQRTTVKGRKAPKEGKGGKGLFGRKGGKKAARGDEQPEAFTSTGAAGGDLEAVGGGSVRRIHFASEPEEVVTEHRERRWVRRHHDSIGAIEHEVDLLGKYGRTWRPLTHTVGAADRALARSDRQERVLYETPGGHVVESVRETGGRRRRDLYVTSRVGESRGREQRIDASLIDRIIKQRYRGDGAIERQVVVTKEVEVEVTDDGERVISERVVEDTASAATKTTTRPSTSTRSDGWVPETKATKKTVTKTAKKPAAKATKAPRSQVDKDGYKLFKNGNRYYFSKKTQKEAAENGGRPVYEVPDGKAVEVTSSGLPVLKNVTPKSKKSA
ncbi:MAG: hypothetical protein ACPGQL_00265 [Thermoplasmatota archaeon]